jgi:hypothetical protein
MIVSVAAVAGPGQARPGPGQPLGLPHGRRRLELPVSLNLTPFNSQNASNPILYVISVVEPLMERRALHSIAVNVSELLAQVAVLPSAPYEPTSIALLPASPALPSPPGRLGLRLAASGRTLPSDVVVQPIPSHHIFPADPFELELLPRDGYKEPVEVFARCLETHLAVEATLISDAEDADDASSDLLAYTVSSTDGRVRVQLARTWRPEDVYEAHIIITEIKLAGQSLHSPHLPCAVWLGVNHEDAYTSKVWRAAEAGDVQAAVTALKNGGSTEEMDRDVSACQSEAEDDRR